MKRFSIGIMALVMALGVFAFCGTSNAKELSEEEINALANPEKGVCPVMGGKVDGETFLEIELDGKKQKFGLCCKGCVGKFKNDPAKYLKKYEGKHHDKQEGKSCGKHNGKHHNKPCKQKSENQKDDDACGKVSGEGSAGGCCGGCDDDEDDDDEDEEDDDSPDYC